MEMYQPEAIVLCCGADSLSGDRLGCFNLSMEGHSHCLEFLTRYNVPMLVLGGGGYTLRNVARCWCYETGRLMGIDLPDNIPEAALNEFNYYLDTQRLRIEVSNMKNANTREELEEIKLAVLQHLCTLPPVPSAHMQYVPPLRKREDLPEEDMDVRGGGQIHEEHRKAKAGDESDEEGDEEGGVHKILREKDHSGHTSAPAASASVPAAANPSSHPTQGSPPVATDPNAPAAAVAAKSELTEPLAVGFGAPADPTADPSLPSASDQVPAGASTPATGGAYEAASLANSQALKARVPTPDRDPSPPQATAPAPTPTPAAGPSDQAGGAAPMAVDVVKSELSGPPPAEANGIAPSLPQQGATNTPAPPAPSPPPPDL
eukprot:gene22386-29493_t